MEWAIIFSAPTLAGYLPFNVKKLLLLIMLLITFYYLFLFTFFHSQKYYYSWAITERKERNIP